METQLENYISYLTQLLRHNHITYQPLHSFDNNKSEGSPAPHTQFTQPPAPFYLTNIDPTILSSKEIERYSRQMLLKEIAYPGQLKLKDAKVAIIGCGGIGCPGSLYLAAAGVGTLGLFDNDRVQLNNLHRQIAHKTSTIGVQKVYSLSSALLSLNPHTTLHQHPFITPETVSNLDNYDIVIDGSDNPRCRYIVNDYCMRTGKMLFSGACIGWEAQITAFCNNQKRETACYRCIWGDDQEQTGGCATRGVVGAVPGLVALILGIEVIKFLVSGNSNLFGSMILYDGTLCSFRKTKLRGKKNSCIACGTNKLDIKSYNYSKYDATCALDPPQVRNISWTQLINNKINTTSIIDVRSSSMFGIVNLNGTTNISLQQLRSMTPLQIQERTKDLLTPTNQVYVMCKRGNDSRRAAKLLVEVGVDAVNVVGGIEQYGKECAVDIPSI